MLPKQVHKFVSNEKGGRKGKKGQTKKIRKGSRTPGASGNKPGSIRKPY